MKTQNIYICDGVRTPFGKYGGSLASIRTDDLAAIPLKHLADKYKNIELFDEVILGCANQAGEDNRNIARMSLLLAGLDYKTPGITLNRLCASGMESIASAFRKIALGEADIIVAGGVESMSRAPFVMGKADRALGRNQILEDTTMGWRFVNPKLEELYGTESMPKTGENVAEDYKISREDQDAFAYRSQERYQKAHADGIFERELMNVDVPPIHKKDAGAKFIQDEHPRESSLEVLAKLRPIVKKDGTITAGNASGINDGSVALLVASEEMVEKYNLKPIAKILGSAAVGVEPRVMGMGPVNATKKLLSQHQLKVSDIDLFEINEAFASQSLAVLRELGIADDADFVNAHGGAIALGHPLGASGARISLHAALELQRQGLKYAVATMCVGVGQGSALLLEGV